jgi:fructose-1-phosphate kinase PfkB-like protein
MIVCLAANPSIDKLFEIDRLVKGDIHRPQASCRSQVGRGSTWLGQPTPWAPR